MTAWLVLAAVGLVVLTMPRTLPPSRSSRQTRMATRRLRPQLLPLPGLMGVILLGGSWFAAAMTGILIWLAVEGHRRHQRTVQERLRRDALPEVVELVALGIGAGGTVMLGLELVQALGPEVVQQPCARALRRSRSGERRRVALSEMAEQLGSAYRPFVDVLIAGDRDGAAIGEVLDRLAAEATAAKRRQHEERVRRTPVKLLMPLVLCGLPAVLVGTVVPLVFLALGSVELPGSE